jgi:hypothetical protein
MNESPLTAVIGFLIGTFGLDPRKYENDQIIEIQDLTIYDVPQFPPGDQSSGQGSGQGVGSGISGGDNPFGNWDGSNNAAQSSMGTAGNSNDRNNNGIPDDIDALLG